MSSAGWHEGGGRDGGGGREGRGGGSYVQEWVRGLDEGERGNQGCAPATGISSTVGTGRPATAGCPFRWARNGTVARTCCVIPQHRDVERLRMTFSWEVRLVTTPVPAANSAISLRTAKAQHG